MVLNFTNVISPILLLEDNVTISQAPSSIITYGSFLEYVDNGWVKKVDFYDNSKFAVVEAATPESGYKTERFGVNIPNKEVKLIRKLKESKINFDVHAVEESTKLFESLSGNFFTVAIIFGLIIGFYYLYSQLTDDFDLFNFDSEDQNNNNPFNRFGFRQFFQTRARYDNAPVTGITFDDVAGIDEVKEEFQEIVSFLKKPERYNRVGAKIPKGILVSGPPGTGKTMLAKAIAGEAKVPFFNCSASEFVELFVGIGASRVRDLFARAKAKTPCIVFIDEIDAVGRQRGFGVGGGNDEREQTLNQLLTEMDGFEPNNGVIVIAATNRADILDAALLRPGRFDRQLTVGLPDATARLAILNVHAKGKKLDENISLATVAKRTSGFSGADLANIMNESAILTARYGDKFITMKRINEALDKVTGGLPKPPMEENRYKRVLAYHESGHALCASLLEYHDAVELVSLIPRGRSRSSTTYVSSEETMYSRHQILSRLITLLAGRAAERIVFGEAEVTTIAADDIQQATSLARKMVTDFGMSPLGPVALEYQQPSDAMIRPGGRPYSNALASAIDGMVRFYIEYAYVQALKILKENRRALDKLANRLLQNECLDGYEIRSLLADFKQISLIIPTSKLNVNSPVIDQVRQEMEKLYNTEKYLEKLKTARSQDDEDIIFNEIVNEAFANLENNENYKKLLLTTGKKVQSYTDLKDIDFRPQESV
uniref:ATP-dependent zinc metalloprotease FtsH n=1 Tax=Eustigmatophyceae sp. Mont 10/10-1w TaxID=2506145 RepID=A0A451FMQ7_9STRA|nr:cell division protein FTSH [Eustigmatophyceae sp. Mont 10/10-1w]QAA11698.1 cell division protein FTSH [Eustigmatophyceae sp. Mont 10/10-1w]